MLSSSCSDLWPLGTFKFNLESKRGLSEARPWEANGIQVGVAVGLGFAGTGREGHCQARLGFEFPPQTGKLAFRII